MSPLLLAWAVLGLVLAASLLLYTLLSLGQAWYRHKLSTSGTRIQGESAGSPGPLLTGSQAHIYHVCVILLSGALSCPRRQEGFHRLTLRREKTFHSQECQAFQKSLRALTLSFIVIL